VIFKDDDIQFGIPQVDLALEIEVGEFFGQVPLPLCARLAALPLQCRQNGRTSIDMVEWLAMAVTRKVTSVW
jgi:hypothetical protein